MQGIEEIYGCCVEEELVISDAGGLVLLFEDFVVVETELEVCGTVSKYMNE